MRTLALFDFDGTLYKKDSLLQVTRHIVGEKKFLAGLLRLSPSLIMLKLGLLNNEKAKIKYLTHFFGGMNYNTFCGAAKGYALSCIEKDLTPVIYNAFLNHIKNNDSVLIVTASCSEWIEPWATLKGVGCIASRLEVIEDVLTGKLLGQNCYGVEKVKRIESLIDLSTYDCIKVYGNGKGDLEMMALKQ